MFGWLNRVLFGYSDGGMVPNLHWNPPRPLPPSPRVVMDLRPGVRFEPYHPSAAIAYLRAREWSMGHGQCHDCCGLGPSWSNDPLGRGKEIGHRLVKRPGTLPPIECPLAAALKSLGEAVLVYDDKGA